MITMIRSLVALPGRNFEYLTVARELAEIATHAIGRQPVIATAVGGDPLAFGYIYTFENLADLEEARDKLMSDSAYRTALTKTDHLVVPGSFRDQIWRHM